MRKTIAFSSFPDYSGNSKALFEDFNKINDEHDLVWFCKDKNIADKLNKKGIKAIWDKSEVFEKEEFNLTRKELDSIIYSRSYKIMKKLTNIFKRKNKNWSE